MSEVIWLTSSLVQAIHAHQLKLFGGPPGIPDEGALESALGRPVNRAAYAFGIAKNLPFNDGNERAALLALVTFLGVTTSTSSPMKRRQW